MKNKYLVILVLSLGLFWGSQAKAAESPIASTKVTEALVDAFSFQTDGTIEVSVDKLTVDNIVIDGDSITNASNDITIGNITISALTNSDGIVFGSLGTAGIGIDLSGSGLGGGDLEYLGLTVLFEGNADPEIGSWGSDGVSNGSTTITDVGGAAHGLSLAAGDLVHIKDSSTSADKGFYRIVSDDGTSVVVDRALSGSDTDLDVTFYKDVIGFFATDGTNGQRIMNYSHQDKPLQIGGDTLAATAHSLGSEDVLIGDMLEVNGSLFADGSIELPIARHIGFKPNNFPRLLSTNAGAQSDTMTMLLGVDNVFIFGNALSSRQWDTGSQTNPTVFIFSGTDPDTANDEWWSITHDQTDALMEWGSGLLSIMGTGTANLGIGVASSSGTETNTIAIGNGIPPAGVANQSYLYARDISASSELFGMDEGGNEAQLTGNTNEYPSDMVVSADYPYVNPRKQIYAGVKTYISEHKALELLQDFFRTQGILQANEFIIKHVQFAPEHNWESNQEKQRLRREQKIQDAQDRIAQLDVEIAAKISKIDIEIDLSKKLELNNERNALQDTRASIVIPSSYAKKNPVSQWLISKGVKLQ